VVNAHPVFDELFARVDDLIRRVADAENPEIRKLRARVYGDMVAAKHALATRAYDLEKPTLLSESAARPHEDPVETLGVALLIGLGVGFIAYPPQ